MNDRRRPIKDVHRILAMAKRKQHNVAKRVQINEWHITLLKYKKRMRNSDEEIANILKEKDPILKEYFPMLARDPEFRR